MTGKQRNKHFRQDVRKVGFFFCFCFLFSHKAGFTIQLVQLSYAMRSEDDSCMDKVKEIYPRSKFYHLKVENIKH